MHEEPVDVLDLEVVGVGRLDFDDPPFHRIVENHFDRCLEQLFLAFQFFDYGYSVVCAQTTEYLTQVLVCGWLVTQINSRAGLGPHLPDRVVVRHRH